MQIYVTDDYILELYHITSNKTIIIKMLLRW